MKCIGLARLNLSDASKLVLYDIHSMLWIWSLYWKD